MDVRVGLWRKLSTKELIPLNCGVGEDSWESPGLQGDPTSPSQRRSVLGVHWKDWCWSWKSNPLATWWEELTHWKRPWCWEGLEAGGEGNKRGWDRWMASWTQWKWVWVNSGSLWWTGKPDMLQPIGSQRVGYDWGAELNWLIYINVKIYVCVCVFPVTQLSLTQQPHVLQPARLLWPWNFLGMNSGVGCHFLLQEINK